MIANKYIGAAFLLTTFLVYIFYFNVLTGDTNTNQQKTTQRYQYPKPESNYVFPHQQVKDNEDSQKKKPIEDIVPEQLENTDPPVDTLISDLDLPHHHDILIDRNLTLINITNFKFLINSDICNVSQISLVTMIHSSSQNSEAREMIRATWGNPQIPETNTRLVFLLGSTSDEKLQKSIVDENKKFGDIIQGDFIDSYHNLSYKAIMGNLWAAEFCEQAEFVVKTDDDMFIDLYEVYALTRRYKTNAHYVKNRFILCPVWRGLPILRDKNSKWGVSYEEIPRDEKYPEGHEIYPTDCSGWIWITSPGTSKAVAEAAKTVRFFWIDDVWVTGYIAKHLKIEHQDLIKFWTMKADQLLLYKSIQNPADYVPDYLSGPMNRDKALNMALHRRARWCYLNKCNNNIYNEHIPKKITELAFSNIIKKIFPFN